jgi:ribonuclease-3
MIRSPYRQLNKALGYRIKRSRLEQALTHPSFSHEQNGGTPDNQRLEFLGDAALGLAAAEALYERHPDAPEGDLTRLRSLVTSTKGLARIASRIQLGVYLRLGRGELNSGGRERPSILADALEAVLGAAYLDGGMRAVRRIFRHLFLADLPTSGGHGWTENPKGRLQEWAQGQGAGNPRYVVVHEEGPPHQRQYTVEARLQDKVIGVGRGSNKRDAETAAAAKALTINNID